MWQWGEGSGGGVGNMVWWCQTFLFFLKNICHVYNLAHDEATLTSSGTVIFVFTFFAVCQKKLIAKRFTACAKKDTHKHFFTMLLYVVSCLPCVSGIYKRQYLCHVYYGLRCVLVAYEEVADSGSV
jgi:hypothetical protein